MTLSPALRARLRRVAWPLGVWLVALACIVPFWSHATPHLCHRGYWLSGDSGLAVYNAWAAGDGLVMYRDIFEYRTPLFFLVHGALMQVVGPSPAWNQWLTLGYVSATAPILWAVSVRLGAGRLVSGALGVAAVVLLFAVWPFSFPHWLAWPFLALTAHALVRAYDGADVDRGWLARAGMFATIALLAAHFFTAPYVAGATLGVLVFTPRARWRATAWFVGGGVLVALPVIVYLAAHGALDDALWDTVTFPTQYYYNGFTKGRYPLAAVFEYWQRYGACSLPGASAPVNGVYTASVASIPVLGVTGLVVTATAAVAAVRAVRRRRMFEPRDRALAILCVAAALALVPNVLHWSISDNVHLGMATLVGLLPFAALAVRGPRAWRWFASRLVIAIAAIAVFVSIDRWQRYTPLAKQFRDFDGHVARTAGLRWLRDLSEPGDTVVNIPYGGWQYLTSGRHSGLSAAFVFNDDKLFPPRMWQRFVDDLRARQPALLHFGEKPLEARFFRMDPTLRERYFWNGLLWERLDPAIAVTALAPAYRVTRGHRAGDVIRVTQDGQQLTAVRTREGAPDLKLVGSVRGDRVWLRGAGETYYGHRGADGRLVGEGFAAANGKPLTLEPVVPVP
jgi:hypothetical protein